MQTSVSHGVRLTSCESRHRRWRLTLDLHWTCFRMVGTDRGTCTTELIIATTFMRLCVKYQCPDSIYLFVCLFIWQHPRQNSLLECVSETHCRVVWVGRLLWAGRTALGRQVRAGGSTVGHIKWLLRGHFHLEAVRTTVVAAAGVKAPSVRTRARFQCIVGTRNRHSFAKRCACESQSSCPRGGTSALSPGHRQEAAGTPSLTVTVTVTGEFCCSLATRSPLPICGDSQQSHLLPSKYERIIYLLWMDACMHVCVYAHACAV